MVTSRALYGHVPDPTRLCDVAELISREPASRWSHEAIHAALIAGFWRGEFEQDGHSVVFTLGTPPGALVGDDGGVYHMDEDNERLQEVMVDNRDPVFWNRSEVVAALLKWDRDFVPPRYSTQEAVYRALSAWPLDHWSSFSRYMFWDQLCITLADLADWLSRTGQPMPRFLIRDHSIEAALGSQRTDTSIETDPATVRAPGKIGSETACEQWLKRLMRAGDREKTKPEYFFEAQIEFSGLSRQGFDRAWANAVSATGNVSWSRAGRLR